MLRQCLRPFKTTYDGRKKIEKIHLPAGSDGACHDVALAAEDLAAIGALCLAGVFCAAQFGTAAPLLCAAGYAFLTVRFEGQSIRDFLHSAGAYFFTPREFSWDGERETE